MKSQGLDSIWQGHQQLSKKVSGFPLVFAGFRVSGNLEKKFIYNMVHMYDFEVPDLTLSGTAGKLP